MVQNKVADILSDLFGVEAKDIELTDSLEDIGADILGMVDLSLALESEFDLEISDEDYEKWETVDDVVNYIEEKI